MSTVLGRLVIPVYYLLGERARAALSRRPEPEEDGPPTAHAE